MKRRQHLDDLIDLYVGDQHLQHLEEINNQYQEVLSYLDSFRHDVLDGLDSADMKLYINNANNNLEMAMDSLKSLWQLYNSQKTESESTLYQQQKIVDTLTKT